VSSITGSWQDFRRLPTTSGLALLRTIDRDRWGPETITRTISTTAPSPTARQSITPHRRDDAMSDQSAQLHALPSRCEMIAIMLRTLHA
jgi:hypothetical protein